MLIYKVGYGLINTLVDSLPFEAHVPGYQYCGPGTKLAKRLARGDPGINKLDAACKVHDIAYSTHKGDRERAEADKKLAEEAWKRVKSLDAGIGERGIALAVAAAMRGKIGLNKLGRGLKKRLSRTGRRRKTARRAAKQSNKRTTTVKKGKKKKKKTASKCCSFKKMIAHAKKSIKMARPKTADYAINTALAAAKSLSNSKTMSSPRIIPVPKTGGVLPLVPIFAGLSALGSLAGGAASIIRAIKSTDDGRQMLKRNGSGSVVVGSSKSGSGLYLKPYKNGCGLYLAPYPAHSKN